MRNKFTHLSIGVLVFALGLSSGATYARNILPDAFKYLERVPGQGANYSTSSYEPGRISPIDDRSLSAVSKNDRLMRMAARLMSQAINARNNGDLGKACRLASEATNLVSRNTYGSPLENDYATFTEEVCAEAGRA